jgi:hypothetical protein
MLGTQIKGPVAQTGPERKKSDMIVIAENESEVNTKLRFGKIVRSPIVAWGFDTATANLSPVPLAAGNYGRFVTNEHDSTWQFVQALPGNSEVSYVVAPEHWKAFDEKEMRRSAGAVFLGVEIAGVAGDDAERYASWLDLALDYEAECGPES